MKLLLLLATWLALTGGVRAAPPVLADHARLFDDDTAKEFHRILADLPEGVDFYLETFDEDPTKATSKRGWWSIWPRFGQDKNHVKLAGEKAEKLGVNGLYVMILKEPPSITVIAEPPAKGWYQDGLGSNPKSWKKVRRFRKTFDGKRSRMYEPKAWCAALLAATKEYKYSVEKQADLSPLTTIPAVAAAGGVFLFWLALRAVRARSANRSRIYQPAMLGSLFGVAAGFWINDRLFQAERPNSSSSLGSFPSLPSDFAPPSRPSERTL